MNAVEIEEAVSALADAPFDPAEFPYAFLEAFGNKATTIKRLRSGTSNKSDVGGVLQTNNIHLSVAEAGQVTETLARLRASPATAKAKAKFILATDGETFEAEDTETGETVACAYAKFPDHFGFFLALAGITTVRQVRESSFDIRATGRLNKLYVELLKDNPDWGAGERRPDMNHFMARLIFCFFAEDTDIFHRSYPFTGTVEQMSERDSSNTHEVIGELFRAMNTPLKDRSAANLPRWADAFPYVNGGLFSGSLEVPRFSRIARSYLLHIGNLDWTRINPDIFGSMIQAVADDEERGALGMHYTSVPNILKVLNPLFLDDLREKLAEAGDNVRKLLNLRNRMARIRVFDPACGSGNFLVIAYKEMREIEAEINKRRGEAERASDLPLTNFRGIELRDFPAEIARLALIIAEFQADVLYRGQQLALAEFLPLDQQNWITCGNALRVDWLSICPPTGTGVKLTGDDLFETPLDQPQIDFENEGGETYLCGNPPYKGSKWQSAEQKSDMKSAWEHFPSLANNNDYVTGWVAKAVSYFRECESSAAFVMTNSVVQGQQAGEIWSSIFSEGVGIKFAHLPFKWRNLASHNAGVTVVIVGIGREPFGKCQLFENGQARTVDHIGCFLVPNQPSVVKAERMPISALPDMVFGNMPRDGGHLLLSYDENLHLGEDARKYVRPYVGAQELIDGTLRYCLWVNDEDAADASSIRSVRSRLDAVTKERSASKADSTRKFAKEPHRFVQRAGVAVASTLAIPSVTSENRDYLPCDLLGSGAVISNRNFGIFDGPIWAFSLIVSKLHWVWVATVCGRLEMRFVYSNTVGWNTFPVPSLTDKMKADLTRCAEDILLAREAHFPKTIADLYNPQKMPEDLRAAHDRNEEVLERIYIGRRFKNDTERLEKLFAMYSEMTGKAKKAAA